MMQLEEGPGEVTCTRLLPCSAQWEGPLGAHYSQGANCSVGNSVKGASTLLTTQEPALGGLAEGTTTLSGARAAWVWK